MLRLLLDTHVLLWWCAGSKQLKKPVQDIIVDPDNEIFVSAASGYEIAIKRALGKLETTDNLNAQVDKEGFVHLPVTFFHAEQAGQLPFHHRDPFDRILIAQAQAEGLIVVTRDANFHHYGVRTIMA
ncbi:MAG: type II toxin-antitoxin system VapC family toxin [Gammaproteobacteria bacterium]|nr:type II toxin-antitoxin system VapC family toxin [Gammaproteobacteria bacterium]